jgi:hypothetical protein
LDGGSRLFGGGRISRFGLFLGYVDGSVHLHL